jgi:hypothetical protein
VALLHDCEAEADLLRSIPFALGATELATLPSVVKKMDVGIQATPKDVMEAITSDLPIAKSELNCLQSRKAAVDSRATSVLAHALQIAREVGAFMCWFFED